MTEGVNAAHMTVSCAKCQQSFLYGFNGKIEQLECRNCLQKETETRLFFMQHRLAVLRQAQGTLAFSSISPWANNQA